MDKVETCCGCKGVFEKMSGPTHRYMSSAPKCWALYGDILEREYSNPDYFSVHRLTVDTYAIQHPGSPSSECISSVALHLLSLHSVFEVKSSLLQASNTIKTATQSKGLFEWLPPPIPSNQITVLNIIKASNSKEHVDMVWNWAENTWNAWSCHHDKVSKWYREIW